MATSARADAPHSVGRLTSEILDRLPPQNLDAEKAVIGSLLLDCNLCDDVVMILRPEDFYADANQKLYRHLLAMHETGKRIDAMLLVEHLKQAGDFEAVGESAYIAEVAQSVPYAANAVYYAQIVREKATLRELIHAGTEILRDAYDTTVDSDEIVSQAEQKIFAVHDQRSVDQITNIHDLMVQAFDRIDARLEGKGGVGIPTGFHDLDNLTGGLHDSELVILAARPSMGKTALATNIAENVIINSDITTLFVSLEMARLELAQRLLCSQGKIDANKFRSGFLSGDDRRKLVEASAKLGNKPLFIDDTPVRTITQIGACARRLKRKHNLGLLVIDYLQLIQPDDPRDPRQEQVAKMTRRLKALARELQIPVICVAQLNRQADVGKASWQQQNQDEEKIQIHRPTLSQLRESGAIEQDADVVLLVNREEYYQTREEAERTHTIGVADVTVAKQRNGPTGHIKLAWFSKYTRFETLAQKPYEEFSEYSAEEF